MTRKLLLVGMMLLLLVGSAAGVESVRKAPLFQLDDVNGTTVKLSSYIGTNVILLDFWATGCAPCVQSMPHIQSIWEKYEDEGLVVIGISEDLPRNVSSVKAKARELGVTYSILIDKNAAALSAYQGGDTGIPFVVVIDRSGNISATFRHIQPGDEDKIDAAVKAALGL